MRHVTDFPRPIEVHEDIRIEMPDGTRLSARLWLPQDAGADPVPLILEHLPYRKRDGTIARDELTHPYLAGHGYACLRVDMRGNGDSEGLMADEYTPQELQDACDVIAWARAQPWCSGTAGMMGISWGGFNSLQVAALRPEGLKAVISICSTADRFADDIHYKGGCQLGENLGWASQMLAYSSRPPDPEIVGDGWRETWLHRLENQPFLLEEWLSHQRRDAYWRHGSVCEDWSAIEAAVLTVGGWHDGYRNTPANLVSNLKAPVKGIVGPWIHKYPHFAGPEPAIGFLQEALRWWDRWLKGIETGVEDDPAMRLWLMDGIQPRAWLDERPGRWIAEAEWPSPRIPAEVFHLTQEGLTTHDGPLDRRVSSPADCGQATGEYFPFAYGPELPLDQRPDDALSVCFDGPLAPEPTDIVGAPVVRLRLAADAPQAQVAVRLTGVFPDGTSALISYGFLNLAHRDGPAEPVPLVPDEEVEVTVTLDQCAYRLPAGHRLRVAISTAYWPFLWPSPEPVELSLRAGRLELPVRPLSNGPEWHFEPPEAAPAWDAEEETPGRCTRRREVDLATGESVMTVTNDTGHLRDRAHCLATRGRSEERWTIRPSAPTSARAEMRWTEEMDRGDWRVRTECETALRADETHWHLTATLKAFEGDEEVFAKAWDRRIARDNM
ncbi:CocE/NonD family hydrolase [Wenxinia marina]|uniref:Putative hydrolase, CocE/NonD family n=1 Tax=Wenxinia marina DSM 24838 TaxID=1123501 RepID=A0A0D0NSU9_9RHOB|nr:CocE/NonD family hydrolase [Wenxinia marina]KIQ71255.1 putative hydrolase, CocE/NonD family [Wenxinia marina DSM 24838]GGL73234.1 peptidase S15 [Wenxinia marina]